MDTPLKATEDGEAPALGDAHGGGVATEVVDGKALSDGAASKDSAAAETAPPAPIPPANEEPTEPEAGNTDVDGSVPDELVPDDAAPDEAAETADAGKPTDEGIAERSTEAGDGTDEDGIDTDSPGDVGDGEDAEDDASGGGGGGTADEDDVTASAPAPPDESTLSGEAARVGMAPTGARDTPENPPDEPDERVSELDTAASPAADEPAPMAETDSSTATGTVVDEPSAGQDPALEDPAPEDVDDTAVAEEEVSGATEEAAREDGAEVSGPLREMPDEGATASNAASKERPAGTATIGEERAGTESAETEPGSEEAAPSEAADGSDTPEKHAPEKHAPEKHAPESDAREKPEKTAARGEARPDGDLTVRLDLSELMGRRARSDAVGDDAEQVLPQAPADDLATRPGKAEVDEPAADEAGADTGVWTVALADDEPVPDSSGDRDDGDNDATVVVRLPAVPMPSELAVWKPPAEQSPAGEPRTPTARTAPEETATTAAVPAAAESGATAEAEPEASGETASPSSSGPVEGLDLVGPFGEPPIPRRPRRRMITLAVAAVLVVLVVAAVIVQLVRPLPVSRVRLTAAASYSIPGTAPALPWPTDGQAAVEVLGMGQLGTSGTLTPVPIASVTKVMTAYIVLRDHPLGLTDQGPIITISQAQAAQYPAQNAAGDSLVPVAAGEALTERQALEALLLPSADNIADILAQWDAASIPAFVVKMNAAASALGMTQTVYTGASGLDQTTVSTAPDLLKLGEKAMQDPAFASIVALPYATIPVAGTITNVNSLVGEDGVVGIKTGSTTPAGGCLLFAAQQTVVGKSYTIIGAVLAQHGDGSLAADLAGALSASRHLILASTASLKNVTVIPAGTVVGRIEQFGNPDVELVTAQDLSVVGWPGLDERLTLSTMATPRDAASGTHVGTATMGTPSGSMTVPVVTRGVLQGPSVFQELTRS